MKRLRALAALLSCLAILAGSFVTVAEAATVRASADRNAAVGAEPCSHCDDCGGMPCPKPAAACLQVLSAGAPALAVASVELPAMDFQTVPWSPSTTAMSGLSPPPDPFPPRI